MSSCWILVANNTHGRLFRYVRHQGLEELEVMVNPEARMKEQDLVSDAPGRGLNRPRASRFAMSSPSDQKTHESDLFAQSLARRLNAARRNDTIERIHIIAEPSLLGKLRARLDDITRECVRSEIVKNVTQLDAAQIRDLLPRKL